MNVAAPSSGKLRNCNNESHPKDIWLHDGCGMEEPRYRSLHRIRN